MNTIRRMGILGMMGVMLCLSTMAATIGPAEPPDPAAIPAPTVTTPVAPVAPAGQPAQLTLQDFLSGVDNALKNQSDATNLFTPGEVEFRLGGVYVQSTGEGGTLLAVEKWDVFTANLGFGVEGISSGQNQAAEFLYVGYRHTMGNVAGALTLGAGYDELSKEPLMVIGGRIEYRTTKHLGTWASVNYGIEPKQSNSRGMVVGGGLNYSF